MQKILKRISSFLLAIVMCLGITAVVNTASQTIVADAATVEEYYSPITASSGTQLLGQLHDLMVSTHKTYTTYGDCSEPDYVKKTDPGSSSSYVKEFYSQADISATWGSGSVGTWNREHVWPKSLSNGLWTNISNGGKGGGADMHHIRPAESQVNSTRGNDTFGVVSGGKTVYYQAKNAEAGKSGGGTFEPINKVKGDVARIVMYVYMHYNKASNVSGSSSDNSYFGTLNFSDVMSGNETAAKKLLLEWNAADPVDNVERTRNEAVYEIQGNRNPFIDHPEYADAIWGNGTVTPNPGGSTSTELTGLTITPSTLSLNAGASQALSVTATPSGASNAVTWTSSNTEVATVSSNGTVTAVAAGTATVTATSTANQNIKATCQITVNAATVTPPVDNPPVDDPPVDNPPVTPGTSTEDTSKLAAFHSAVADISSNITLPDRFTALSKAITAYQALSDAEKASAATDIAALQAAIAKYNEDLLSYNGAAESADNSALHAFTR